MSPSRTALHCSKKTPIEKKLWFTKTEVLFFSCYEGLLNTNDGVSFFIWAHVFLVHFSSHLLMWGPTQKPALHQAINTIIPEGKFICSVLIFYLESGQWYGTVTTWDVKLMKNFNCGLWSVQINFHFQNCITWLAAARARIQGAGESQPFLQEQTHRNNQGQCCQVTWKPAVSSARSSFSQ